MGLPLVSGSVFARTDLAAHVSQVNNKAGFAVGRCFPAIMVEKPNGTLMVLKANTGMENVDTRRDSRSNYKQIAADLTSVSYNCEEHGIEFPADAARAAMYKDQIDLDKAGAEWCANTVARRMEKSIWDEVYGAVSGNNAGTAWDTYASATPAADVANEAATMFASHGINKDQLSLVIPAQIAHKLPFVSDLRTALKIQTQPLPGSLTEQQLALYFGVKEVIIAGAAYNSANEGQTASLSYCHPTDKCLLFLKSEGNVQDSPGFARIPIWEGDMVSQDGEAVGVADISGVPVLIEQYWESKTRCMNYRARHWRDLLTMTSTLARYVGNID